VDLAEYLERLRVAGLEPRYAINSASKVAHLIPTLEVCNMDDATTREVSDHIPPDFQLCGHCARNLERQP
jgi:hypothetical protein